MAGLPSQTLISARAKFQAEVWLASSGKAIDGVLMMSGFTDKSRAGPGQAAEGRLSTVMGTRHLSPLGLPQPAPSRARRLEAGERWARLAQARAASRPGLCAIAPVFPGVQYHRGEMTALREELKKVS